MSTTKSFLQGEPTTFKKLYPLVKSLKLSGREHGDFREVSHIPYESRGIIHYTESNIPAEIPCGNPKCQQGGHNIQWLIEGVISNRKTSEELDLSCNGHEGTPKGRHRGGSCCNFIKATIEVEYEK